MVGKDTHYRARLLVFVILLIIVAILCAFESKKLEGKAIEVEDKVVVEEVVANATPQKPLLPVLPPATLQATEQEQTKEEITATERYYLAKIAMAEAEGESIEGKALVILTILNRVNSDEFPDTIEEVIFQHKEKQDGTVTYQFSPVRPGGRWWTTEPTDSCYNAVELVIDLDWDESKGALYFESSKSDDNWHSRNLEFLFKNGGHRFYK